MYLPSAHRAAGDRDIELIGASPPLASQNLSRKMMIFMTQLSAFMSRVSGAPQLNSRHCVANAASPHLIRQYFSADWHCRGRHILGSHLHCCPAAVRGVCAHWSDCGAWRALRGCRARRAAGALGHTTATNSHNPDHHSQQNITAKRFPAVQFQFNFGSIFQCHCRLERMSGL